MKRNSKPLYCGLFVRSDELTDKLRTIPGKRLEKLVSVPHVTFAYRPKEYPVDCLGERATVWAFAYGNDGNNEGLLVRVESDSERLRALAERIETPHITCSTARGGRPVDTAALSFTEIPSFSLDAVFGICFADGSVVTEGTDFTYISTNKRTY